jgi:hypothetical protein
MGEVFTVVKRYPARMASTFAWYMLLQSVVPGRRIVAFRQVAVPVDLLDLLLFG